MEINIEQEILDWYVVNIDNEETEYNRSVWGEFLDSLYTKQTIEASKDTRWPRKAPVLPSGPAYLVDDYGGEGLGEERWVVFRVGDELFKVEGYYASWDGTTWEDPSPFRVQPKEVTVIKYVSV